MEGVHSGADFAFGGQAAGRLQPPGELSNVSEVDRVLGLQFPRGEKGMSASAAMSNNTAVPAMPILSSSGHHRAEAAATTAQQSSAESADLHARHSASTPIVRVATAADAVGVTTTLMRAFNTDPVTNWLMRKDDKRTSAMASVYSKIFHEATLPHGHVFVAIDAGIARRAAAPLPGDTSTAAHSDIGSASSPPRNDVRGCALWVPPSAYHQQTWQEKWGYLQNLMKACGVLPLLSKLRGMRTIHAAHDVNTRGRLHYYLFLLAVDTSHQGKGYGSAVLKPVLQMADEACVGCYLENSNPRNTEMYKHHGFVDVGNIDLSNGGKDPSAPPLMAMWREPRAAASTSNTHKT